MCKAIDVFDISIQDAERILEAYDRMKEIPDLGRDPEELKRAALIMSLTAWETYVEDKVSEVIALKTDMLKGSHFGDFINSTLEKELKFFHTPNSKKTKDIFERFLGIDVTEYWTWPGYEKPENTRAKLNEWIKMRGEAVHRAVPDKQTEHLINKKDAEKCIKFFKKLVEVTDKALTY
ncbi:HEPN domain-containing protein [Photobacterium leiognathi]|uniref:HEPN domain-containing protein n=1 Tax=Photobacterium leiognathi TaxID=553611 RepID=UPI002732E34C|nr:HEPN domain-containing protein [Photobacterium leiognathi]